MARYDLAYYEEVSRRIIRYSGSVLGLAEFAQVLGKEKQTVSNLVTRKSKNVPKPDQRLASGPIWYKSTVLEWLLKEVEKYE
jgi:hypothetical protein